LSQEDSRFTNSTQISPQFSRNNQSVAPSSRWIRSSGWKVLLASCLALIPCFWHPRIEAGDLPSHTYNTWLTSLVIHGQAPGLGIASQTNNILFDVLLFRLTSMFGFIVGERIAVCIAVLTFLWGAFLFCRSLSGSDAWSLLPLLITFSYGWTMQMGFFNFYLSLGLSFFALAIVVCARGLKMLYALVFAPFIWLAHPLGFAWFTAIALYLIAARYLHGVLRWILPFAGLASVFLFRAYLSGRYEISWWHGHFYELNGSDQLLLGTRYQFLPLCLLLAIAGCILIHLVQMRGTKMRNLFPLSVELFLVCFFTISLLPDSISLPRYSEPVSLISSRFTLAIAVIACGALAELRPQVLLAVLTSAVAISFFFLAYHDSGRAWHMEQQAQELVERLPVNSRVISTIFPFRGSRTFVHHVVERACIGHCFVVDNYEPASGQFRLRANSANPMAMTSSEDTNRMMLGIYVVKPEDLPLWQIFQCGPRETDLCLRALQPGPLNNQPASVLTRARVPGN
jgi:hypothetical protein